MSLREFLACMEAHQEYHGGKKPKPKPMSRELMKHYGIAGA